jgi:hypothetical protein
VALGETIATGTDRCSKEVNHHRLLCGFASVDAGNPITPAAQEAKLRLVVELAQEVWGGS